MDVNSAIESYAEAWVVSNSQTALNMQDDESGTSNCNLNEPNDAPVIGDDLRHMAHQKPSGVKKTMLHCIVEQCNGPPTFDPTSGLHTNIEKDSYVTLPTTTILSELVRSALLQLNYATTDTLTAIGAIQIKNWKPLTFDQITDNIKSTIDELFSHVSSAVTLRIRISRIESRITRMLSELGEGMQWTEDHVRAAVIDLLMTMSQKSLAIISPLTQPMISYVSNGNRKYKIGPEKTRQFAEWYNTFKTQPDFTAPDMDGYMPQNSRLRFHTKLEIPIMRRWYRGAPLPSNDELQYYLDELNRGPVRQERPKISMNHLLMWWKNERQRLKRIQKYVLQDSRSTNVDDSNRKISHKASKSKSRPSKIESSPSHMEPTSSQFQSTSLQRNSPSSHFQSPSKRNSTPSYFQSASLSTQVRRTPSKFHSTTQQFDSLFESSPSHVFMPQSPASREQRACYSGDNLRQQTSHFFRPNIFP